MSARAAVGLLAASASLAVPSLARACAVCMSGREDDVQFAFLATTGLLSVLPLLFVGGLVWWLRRRFRELEARREARLPPAGVIE